MHRRSFVRLLTAASFVRDFQPKPDIPTLRVVSKYPASAKPGMRHIQLRINGTYRSCGRLQSDAAGSAPFRRSSRLAEVVSTRLYLDGAVAG